MVPLEAHLEAQEALREALELSREQREDRLEAERRAEEAEERALRIARQAQALAEELGAHKRLGRECRVFDGATGSGSGVRGPSRRGRLPRGQGASAAAGA